MQSISIEYDATAPRWHLTEGLHGAEGRLTLCTAQNALLLANAIAGKVWKAMAAVSELWVLACR